MPVPQLVEVENKDLLEEIVQFSDRYRLEELENLLQKDFAKIYLLLCGDLPLGYAVVWIVGNEAELHWLEIFEDFRGRGLGRELLKFLLEELKGRGVKKLHLEVSEKNLPALGLYKSFGFHEVGRRKNYYPDGSDAILMELPLEGAN